MLVVTFVLSSLFAVIVTFLLFALSFSLTVVDATGIADVVAILLMSAIVLRIVEMLAGTLSASRVSAMYAMDVVNVALLVPSILLEVISIGFRSFSLGFRIFANISAGHVLSDIVLVIRYVDISGLIVGIVQVAFSYFVVAYELLVATIQLGVYASLLSVYAD